MADLHRRGADGRLGVRGVEVRATAAGAGRGAASGAWKSSGRRLIAELTPRTGGGLHDLHPRGADEILTPYARTRSVGAEVARVRYTRCSKHQTGGFVMSAPYVPPPSAARGELDYSYYEDEAGYGLVTFAGGMLMIVGILNTPYGIAAIDSSNV